jgi:hypothetical protein
MGVGSVGGRAEIGQRHEAMTRQKEGAAPKVPSVSSATPVRWPPDG